MVLRKHCAVASDQSKQRNTRVLHKRMTLNSLVDMANRHSTLDFVPLRFVQRAHCSGVSYALAHLVEMSHSPVHSPSPIFHRPCCADEILVFNLGIEDIIRPKPSGAAFAVCRVPDTSGKNSG